MAARLAYFAARTVGVTALGVSVWIKLGSWLDRSTARALLVRVGAKAIQIESSVAHVFQAFAHLAKCARRVAPTMVSDGTEHPPGLYGLAPYALLVRVATKSGVEFSMCRLIRDQQVLSVIVGANCVAMVHQFVREERATKVFLHHMPVLADILTVYPDEAVALALSDTAVPATIPRTSSTLCGTSDGTVTSFATTRNKGLLALLASVFHNSIVAQPGVRLPNLLWH